MSNIVSKTTLLALTLSIGLAACVHAQHEDVARPAAWKDLAFGGRFMDRFEPMPLLGQRTKDTWGADAVKPRDVLNGIEEAEWSYWGGNIVQGKDQTYHLFVCRWREDHPKGHMAWHQSEVVRAVSKDRLGPYKVAEVIGPGHNPEVYPLKDGRYVCYAIDSYYLGTTLTGPWEKNKFEFDPRDRKIVANLSNLSFSQREDGSYLMVNRGGGMWVSRDGLSTWEQVTQGSSYPKVKGRFEDPVLWRTQVQYHMIVNDWYGRIAYHLRSKNGVHWKVDAGEAYMPGIAVSEDGISDQWYKYERIKVFLDEHRRAVQANFAVIDYNKWEDKPNDIHSSKNISIPLTAGRLLTLVDKERITSDKNEIQVRIAAEPGFDPHKDVQLDSLRFGAPEEVDFGRGSHLLRTVPDDKDLIAVFSGKGNGFADHSFAGKLLGRTADGKLLFGYCRLPWIDYDEPILTVRRPRVTAQGANHVLKIEVSNHGQVASKPSKVQIVAADMPIVTAACPTLQPYGKTSIDVNLPDSFKAGQAYDLQITTGSHQQQATVFTAKEVTVPAGGIVAAGTLDPQQSEWYRKYKRQKNAPEPEEMRLNTDAEPDVASDFKPLFNGKDLTGWTPKGGTCEFSVRENCIVGTCVPDSPSTYLCTDAADFSDFIFTCEMKWEVDGNSGVMFRAQVRAGEDDRVIVFGPQAEMEGFSKDRGWSGGVYGQSCGGFFYPLWLEEHKEARAALKEGEWNRLTISAQGNVIKTWVNGVPVAHWIDDGSYSRGFFALQIHKGKAGTVLWRNLRIREER